MSRKWPIRTKLRVAVTLLSVILLLLSLSGLWGLYAYKQLAKEVSRQAGEIPIIGELSRLAMDMQESDRRRTRLLKQEAMIDSWGRSFEFADTEKGLFEAKSLLFESNLDRLRRTIEESEEESLLVDNGLRRQRFKEIKETFAEVQALSTPLDVIDVSGLRSREQSLSDLVQQTGKMAQLQYAGMRDFKDDVRGRYNTFIFIAWTATLVAAIFIVALVITFRWHVVKPFVTLIQGTRLIGESPPGVRSPRIDLETGDELSELAEAMNEMTSRFEMVRDDLDAQVKQRTREVIRNEQLASVGFLAAGVAHEINNPLAAIAWSAESIKNQCGGEVPTGQDASSFKEELTESLTCIEEEAYRCKGIIEKLLDFSRLGVVRRSRQDLTELVRDVVSMVGKVGKYRCKQIHVNGAETLPAHVNPQEIRQVVLNLLTNALESVDEDGCVNVTVGVEGENAVVEIKDDGCGMTREVREHLFEPFFTRRRDGTGTGLGLSITYRIVNQHGGSLEAHSEGPGKGSTLVLSLPIDPADSDAPTNFAPRQGRLETGRPGDRDRPSFDENPKQAA